MLERGETSISQSASRPLASRLNSKATPVTAKGSDGPGPEVSLARVRAGGDININYYASGWVPAAGDDRDPLGVVPPLYAEVAQGLVPTKGLLGREDELADLTAFCETPDRQYAWWQADASAGKTALLAKFVADPPAGVLPVSFFITAPQSGQNTSTGFLRDVIAQLEDLSGTSQPPLERVYDQARYLLRLLRMSARLASGRGQRLVLVVDGLDEDDSRASTSTTKAR
jgi:hypothetical protein